MTEFDRLIVTTQSYRRIIHWAKHGATKRLRKKYHGRAFTLIKGTTDDLWKVIDSLRMFAKHTGSTFTPKCERRIARHLRRMGWNPQVRT